MRYRRMIGFLLLVIVPLVCSAQAYPSKPIRLIIPQAVGGATDTIARAIGQALGAQLGIAVVSDNRPGASGNIGTDIVAKAAPDGYTLVAANSNTHSINPNVYEPDGNPLSTMFQWGWIVEGNMGCYPRLPNS